MDSLKYQAENALLDKRNLIVDKEVQLEILKFADGDVQRIAAIETIQEIDETMEVNDNHLNNLLEAMPR